MLDPFARLRTRLHARVAVELDRDAELTYSFGGVRVRVLRGRGPRPVTAVLLADVPSDGRGARALVLRHVVELGCEEALSDQELDGTLSSFEMAALWAIQDVA
jgi:hypothetical protein